MGLSQGYQAGRTAAIIAHQISGKAVHSCAGDLCYQRDIWCDRGQPLGPGDADQLQAGSVPGQPREDDQRGDLMHTGHDRVTGKVPDKNG